MKIFALLAAFLLALSCSGSDKAGENNQRIWIVGIDYGILNEKIYMLGILESEVSGCTAFSNFGPCKDNNCWYINGKYGFISLKNLGACYLSDYIWIIDGDTISSSSEKTYNLNYGEHFVKLTLIDTFGDYISDSTYVLIDEPLRINMFSPVDEYEAHRNDTLVFQYHVSGLDEWEAALEETVYVSTDKNVLENDTLLWTEGKALENKFLKPPLNARAYYWGVKLSNQDTAFYSRIRKVWIKN